MVLMKRRFFLKIDYTVRLAKRLDARSAALQLFRDKNGKIRTKNQRVRKARGRDASPLDPPLRYKLSLALSLSLYALLLITK